MSNNTVVYESKPLQEEIDLIFNRIKNNGEPGFFNLEAARKRKGENNVHGINPCITADTIIETMDGNFYVKDLIGKSFLANVNGKGELSIDGFWSTGVKSVYALSFKNGASLKLTVDHKVLTKNRGWVEAGKLSFDDLVVLNKPQLDTSESLTTQPISFTYIGEEEVFDCRVERVHRFSANGVIVHNCAEILLNSRGFCNLASINLVSFVRSNKSFDLDKALKSIRLATRVCTRMTTVTVSLPKWDKVQKEERLLGVSITGIMDALELLGWTSNPATSLFRQLRKAANDEADSYSKILGIPRPMLVTCEKPEGSLSQLPTVSSGLHRAYAPFYRRRIRVSKMDPVAKALNAIGVPNEPDLGKPERLVFSFPIKTQARQSAAEESALAQFYRYLSLMEEYVDHNASCTLTVGEGEWEEITQAVYDNWDKVVACAFLPKNTDAYPQMPYEEISQGEYEELIKDFPDLSKLYDLVTAFENENGIPEDELEIECSSGQCPVR
jgi:hypothetical protein